MVNKDNMRKVTQALRSEKYEQTQGTMRDADGFCALGVACDVSGLGRWHESEYQPGSYMFFENGNGSNRTSRAGLTGGVIAWLGLTPYDWGIPVHDEDGVLTAVYSLNDAVEDRRDFHQIAALMEKEYEL